MNRTMLWMAPLLAATAPAFGAVSYLKCDVQTVYHRPAQHGTEFTHVENKYSKYFRLDDAAKMVAVYNDRRNDYTPICAAGNKACRSSWNGMDISIDARGGADAPVAPYLDFRRAFTLGNGGKSVQFAIADYGQAKGDKPNMYWTYDGSCATSAAPEPRKRMGPPPGGATNPNYEKPLAPAKAVGDAERDQALAGYYGTTMWGYSGGGHWFRMWFLDRNGMAYTSDDEDMSSEGNPRQWYVGKDSTGYRLCGEPIPAEGRSGCYPLPIRKVGDSWVQHDMDGDAEFELVAGRK